MWKSIPPRLLPIIPLVPFGAAFWLQSTGASPVLQKVALFLFFGAVLLVIIRMRKREEPSTFVRPPLKKVLLNLGLWLIAVFILALAWGNGYGNWGIAAIVLWTIVGVIINLVRKRKSS
jgi:amino acid transporter